MCGGGSQADVNMVLQSGEHRYLALIPPTESRSWYDVKVQHDGFEPLFMC